MTFDDDLESPEAVESDFSDVPHAPNETIMAALSAKTASFLRLLKAIANHLFIPDRMNTAEPKFCTHHKNDCYGRVNSTQTLFDMPFFLTKKRVLPYHNMIKTRFVTSTSPVMRSLNRLIRGRFNHGVIRRPAY